MSCYFYYKVYWPPGFHAYLAIPGPFFLYFQQLTIIRSLLNFAYDWIQALDLCYQNKRCTN